MGTVDDRGTDVVKPSSLFRLLAVDAAISQALHNFFKPFLPTSLLLLLELSADFRLSFPVSVSLFLYYPLLSPLFSPLILGLLFDLAVIGLVKLIFRRSRPPYNPNMSAAVHADNFSFPSGHASRVFFLATLVHLCVRNDTLAPIVVGRWFYVDLDRAAGFALLGVWIWASATASSRVLLGRHFLFDVLTGASVGFAEGIFSFRFLRFELDVFAYLRFRTVQVVVVKAEPAETDMLICFAP